MQRLQCRDFYDLHQLLVRQAVEPNEVWETFEAKARHKNIDPGGFFERFDERVAQYEDRWVDEMSEHVLGQLQPFEAVLRQLQRCLRPFRPRFGSPGGWPDFRKVCGIATPAEYNTPRAGMPRKPNPLCAILAS